VAARATIRRIKRNTIIRQIAHERFDHTIGDLVVVCLLQSATRSICGIQEPAPPRFQTNMHRIPLNVRQEALVVSSS